MGVGRMTGGGEPAEMPVVTGRVLARDDLCLPTGDSGLDFTMGYYLGKIFSVIVST